jgi:predicted dehydrogenase
VPSPVDLRDVSVLVVGGGSIGRRHISNLRTLGIRELSVCDPDLEQCTALESEYGVTPYTSFDEAIASSKPFAVLICTPPHLHIEFAIRAVESASHVFIEKPISNSMDGIDRLIQEAEKRQCTIQVGYNWRFYDGLRKIKELVDAGTIGRVMWARAETGQYLPEWRPHLDYRQNYTAQRAMGGGIILDGSHEIDYIRWLLGEVTQVYCQASTLSDLDVDVEDTASIILTFESGCIGEVHLDFVQRAQSRNCKVVGTDGTIFWDLMNNSLMTFSARSGQWATLPINTSINAMYLEEIKSFLTCITTSSLPAVDARSAQRVLEIALAAHTSAQTKTAVMLSSSNSYE